MRNVYWRNQLVIAFTLLLALVIVFPFSQIGFNDEWAFARTALDLARTGHFAYYGWTATPIGIQAVWGALWIKLFGFSYALLHLCVLPFAIGCGFFTYDLALRFGATPQWARLAAITLVLSPLFLPLAGTYMTDVPGAFFVLLSQWAALRALTSGKPSNSHGWLLLAAVSCLAGATIRQSDLIIATPIVLYASWRRMSRRALLSGSLVLLILAGLILWWFKTQPFAVRDDLALSLEKAVRHPGVRLVTLLMLLAQLVLYALPCGVGLLGTGWWRRGKVWIAPVFLILVLLALHKGRLVLLAPWSDDWGGEIRGGEMVTPLGILMPDGGNHPILLSPLLRLGLSLITLAAASALVFSEKQNPRKLMAAARSTHLHWFLLSCLLYVAILCLRYGLGGPFDRYLIPVLPVFLVFVVTRPELRNTTRAVLPAWCTIALFAFFGAAGTHDYFAVLRTRYVAISRLIEAGVLRSHIMAGIEYDSWTQIDISGHLSNRPVSNSGTVSPERARHLNSGIPLPAEASLVPDIDPSFFITLSPREGLRQSPRFPPVICRTWLPPFRQVVLTLVPAQALHPAPKPVS